jgi:hypothetical protein
MGQGKITKYYHSKPPCQKKKRVEIVKWFEPLNEKENVNKFLVVYEDGTIYIFYVKTEKEDETKPKIIKIPINNEFKEVAAEKIISLMQEAVENYDFNKHYINNKD